MKLIWYPGDDSDPITFPSTVGNVSYILTSNYNGFGGAPVTNQVVKSPNQHGASLLGTVYEPRPISFEVYVSATTLQEILDQQRALIGKFEITRGPGVLQWEQEDGSTYNLNCISSGLCPTVMGGSNNRSLKTQRYTFPMIAHDPFWYSGSSSIAYFSFTSKSFFPFNFPFNFQSQSSPINTINNTGTHSVPVKVIFTGPMTNPKLTNNITGKVLELTLDMAAGDVFTVDNDINELSATYTPSGGSPENGYPYIASSTTLSEFVLVPGNNSITLSADAQNAGSGASIEWSGKYAGV